MTNNSYELIDFYIVFDFSALYVDIRMNDKNWNFFQGVFQGAL